MTKSEILDLAQSIAAKFSILPQVEAIALGGSQGGKVADNFSDLDFYIYTHSEISVELRTEIAQEFSDRREINNQFWEPGDEWIVRDSECGIDIMYRTPAWIEAQLDRVLVHHQASVGYSTCFWWNVLTSIPLFDRHSWFKQLQGQAKQPYPEPLRRAIVAKNYPILRKNISAYTHQIELAIQRQDIISINHRVAGFIASYFDILFAINCIAHPGEKRLIEWANRLCKKLPTELEVQINNLFAVISLQPVERELILRLDRLVDCLEELLIAEGLIKEI